MTIRGWKTQFKEIRKEFGYLEKDDLTSVRKLNSLLKGKNSKNQFQNLIQGKTVFIIGCLLYTSPSPRDLSTSRMPSSA